MNKKSLVAALVSGIAISALAAGCNAFANDPLTKDQRELQNVLDGYGTNYTLRWYSVEDDGYYPSAQFGDGFYLHEYMYQMTGFGRVPQDGNHYHAFDHYRPDNVDPWNGEYFDFGSRRDWSDEKLERYATVSNYLDASKFEKTSDNTYTTFDKGILKELRDRSAYMAGHHKAEVITEETDTGSKIKEIKIYGGLDMMTGKTSEAYIGKIVFEDIGTTVDEVLASYLENLEEVPAPTYYDLRMVGSDGLGLYDGETYSFENFGLSSIVGGNSPVAYGLCENEGSASFLTYEVDKFQGLEYGELANFTATISHKGGSVVLTDIKDVVLSGESGEFYPIDCEGGEGWSYDYGDPDYGPWYNGSCMNIYGATFVGGSVGESGKEGALKFSFTYNGIEYPFEATVVASTSDDERGSISSFVEENELKPGDVVNLYGVMFYMNEGKPAVYVTENTELEMGLSFAGLCELVFGDVPTQYSGFTAYEIFYDMPFETDAGMFYGVIAFPNILDEKGEVFAEEYQAELEAEDWALINQEESEDGLGLFTFRKDDMVLFFTDARFEDNGQGGYYYTQLQIIDLSQPFEF